MSIFRRISLIVSGMLLRLFLFFGFTFLAALIVFGNGESIKSALAETDSYARFTDAVIESGRKESIKHSDDIPFDDPQIQKIIKDSFDAGSLRADSETIVDSIYDWLEGKTPEPTFRVDLTDNKKKLAAGLSNYAIDRLASLPICESLPAQTNIYRIDCQPLYLDVRQQRQALYDTVMRDTSLLKDTVITFQTLLQTEGGVNKYEKAPDYFAWFRLAPWIFFAGALSLATYIVLASRSRRIGIKQVSSVLISTGLALAIAPLIASFVTPSINKTIQSGLGGGPQSVGGVINDVSNKLYGDVNQILINIAIQVLLVGFGIRVVLRMTRTKAPYRGVRKKSGLSSSVGASQKGKALSAETTPVQSSEKKASSRKPSSIKSKYRKI